MEEEDFQPPEICVVGNETTWRMDLPENHGQCFQFSFESLWLDPVNTSSKLIGLFLRCSSR